MANHELAPPTDTQITPSVPVAQLPAEPTAVETLSALRREGQNVMADSTNLADKGLLNHINIGGLSGDEAKIAEDYTRRFALTATDTVDKGVDPSDGAQMMVFRDASGKPQEISIEDKAGSHQYMFNKKGEIVEGRSFDAAGNGVALDHVKWTLDAVTRTVGGRNYIHVYDGDKKLPDWS